MQTHFPELIITNNFHMGKGCQQKKIKSPEVLLFMYL